MTNTKKEIKRELERDINKMSTSAILWHLTRRHDRFLLILLLVCSWAYFIATRLPANIQSMIK